MAEDKDAESEEKEKKEEHEASESDAIEKKEEEETKDKEGKTKDSAEFKDTVSRAEIIVPGFTVDSGKPLVDVKRAVLAEAYKRDNIRPAIEAFTGGPVTDFSKLSGPTVDMAFIGISELQRQANNTGHFTRGYTGDFSKPTDPSTINKANAEFWQKNTWR